jgi:uncharacterized metal-binding protein YceD (DUF177 family)
MVVPFIKIPFDDTLKRELQLSDDSGEIKAEFEFTQKEKNLALCKILITGKLNTNCNTCFVEVQKELNEQIEVLIKNGIYKGFDDNYDVIEVLDGQINLEEMLHSEIEILKDDYDYCEKCSNLEGDFIFEI